MVSCEAVPHYVWCSVAQPHGSTKESHTDMATRLEVDGLATGSSASTKSRSLELLLVLHTLVDAAVLQRTNECSSSGRGRGARCCRLRGGINITGGHIGPIR